MGPNCSCISEIKETTILTSKFEISFPSPPSPLNYKKTAYSVCVTVLMTELPVLELRCNIQVMYTVIVFTYVFKCIYIYIYECNIIHALNFAVVMKINSLFFFFFFFRVGKIINILSTLLHLSMQYFFCPVTMIPVLLFILHWKVKDGRVLNAQVPTIMW